MRLSYYLKQVKPMSHKDFYLEVLKGRSKGQTFCLSTNNITVGRKLAPKEKKKDWILLDEPSLSRIHALLLWDEEKSLFKIVQKSAGKNIIVNGKKENDAYIYHLDKILLGDVLFRLWDGPVDKSMEFEEDSEDTEEIEKNQPEASPLPKPEQIKSDESDLMRTNLLRSDDKQGTSGLKGKLLGSYEKSEKVKSFSFFNNKQESPTEQPHSKESDVAPTVNQGNVKPVDLFKTNLAGSKDNIRESGFQPINITKPYSSNIISSGSRVEASSTESPINADKSLDDAGFKPLDSFAKKISKEKNIQPEPISPSPEFFSEDQRAAYIPQDLIQKTLSQKTGPLDNEPIKEESQKDQGSSKLTAGKGRFSRESRLLSVFGKQAAVAAISASSGTSEIVQARTKGGNKRNIAFGAKPDIINNTSEPAVEPSPSMPSSLPELNFSFKSEGSQNAPEGLFDNPSVDLQNIIMDSDPSFSGTGEVESIDFDFKPFDTPEHSVQAVEPEKNLNKQEEEQTKKAQNPSLLQKTHGFDLGKSSFSGSESQNLYTSRLYSQKKRPAIKSNKSLKLELPSVHKALSDLVSDFTGEKPVVQQPNQPIETPKPPQNMQLNQPVEQPKQLKSIQPNEQFIQQEAQIPQVNSQSMETSQEAVEFNSKFERTDLSNKKLTHSDAGKKPEKIPADMNDFSFFISRDEKKNDIWNKTTEYAEYSDNKSSKLLDNSVQYNVPIKDEGPLWSKPQVSEEPYDQHDFSRLTEKESKIEVSPAWNAEKSYKDAPYSDIVPGTILADIENINNDGIESKWSSKNDSMRPSDERDFSSLISTERDPDTKLAWSANNDKKQDVEQNDNLHEEPSLPDFSDIEITIPNESTNDTYRGAEKSKLSPFGRQVVAPQDLDKEITHKDGLQSNLSGDFVETKSVSLFGKPSNVLSDSAFQPFNSEIYTKPTPLIQPANYGLQEFDDYNTGKENPFSSSSGHLTNDSFQSVDLAFDSSTLPRDIINSAISSGSLSAQKNFINSQTYGNSSKNELSSEPFYSKPYVPQEHNYQAPSPVQNRPLPPIAANVDLPGANINEEPAIQGEQEETYTDSAMASFAQKMKNYAESQEPKKESSQPMINPGSRVVHVTISPEELMKKAKSTSNAKIESKTQSNAKAQNNINKAGSWGLKFMKSPSGEKKFIIKNDEVLIGRAGDIELSLNDLQLAERHVKLYLYDDKLYLQRLDRKKPVFINGNAMVSSASRLLSEGDKIKLSDFTAFEIIQE